MKIKGTIKVALPMCMYPAASYTTRQVEISLDLKVGGVAETAEGLAVIPRIDIKNVAGEGL
jgi:hypothetical protein